MNTPTARNTLAKGTSAALVLSILFGGIYFIAYQGPIQLVGATKDGVTSGLNEGYDLLKRPSLKSVRAISSCNSGERAACWFSVWIICNKPAASAPVIFKSSMMACVTFGLSGTSFRAFARSRAACSQSLEWIAWRALSTKAFELLNLSGLNLFMPAHVTTRTNRMINAQANLANGVITPCLGGSKVSVSNSGMTGVKLVRQWLESIWHDSVITPQKSEC